tara:strand:- start:87535 stop:87801 length:267 start_codon:yes stop_codon:yes gene_type:complete
MHAVLAVFTGFGAISNSRSRCGGNTSTFYWPVNNICGFTVIDGGGIHAIQRFLPCIIPFRTKELNPKAYIVVSIGRSNYIRYFSGCRI